MMLGIYTSVVNTTIGAEKLVLDDFFYVRKLLFPPAGSTSTPPHTLPQVSRPAGLLARCAARARSPTIAVMMLTTIRDRHHLTSPLP